MMYAAPPATLALDGASKTDGARLDVAFGANVPFSMSESLILLHGQTRSNIATCYPCYRKHEKIKKRAYEQRVRDIEHGSFTPSLTGGMGPVCYKRLASMIALQQNHRRCSLNFALLRKG